MLALLSALLASFIVFASLACSGADSEEAGGDTLKVVATTTQIGDFARTVGGDRIALTVLLSPNQDAHDFELEPSQIRAVADADVVLRNGVGLDAFLDKALESAEAAVATLSDGIETREGGHRENEEHEEGEEDEHSDDPHIWFSAANASRMVENLRDALTAKDAANGDYYTANAAAYLRSLDTLDAEIRAAVDTIPPACRKLVTNHEVLGYYAAAYGLTVVGSVIPSTTSGAQASASDVAGVVRLLEAERVPAIFSEASINPDLIRQIGREAAVTVVDDLYGDSLGPAGSDGATYVEMMRANTQKIVAALKPCPSA